MPRVPNISTATPTSSSTVVGETGGVVKRFAYYFLSTLAGAVARTFHSKLFDTVSAFDFMTTAQIADVQAGTASIDVTSALQAAINSARSVYLPAGTYLIQDAADTAGAAVLSAVSNLTLYGEGESSVLKLGAHTTTAHYMLRTHSANNVTVRNLKFDGNKAAQTGVADEFSHCIHIRDSLNVTVENCSLTNSVGDGVDVYATSDPATQNILITNNRIDSNTRQGVSVVRGLNIRIIGNDIANTSGSAPGAGIDVESDGAGQANDNIVITGNTIRGNYWGVMLFGTAPARKTILANNTFKGNRAADVFCRGENVAISANFFELDGKTATYPAIDIHSASQISVTGNTILGSYGANERGGIRVGRGVVGCSIVGNAVEGTQGSGIALYPYLDTGGSGPARSITVVGNTLVNCLPDSSTTGPLLLGGTASHELYDVTISGNSIYDSRSGGLEPDYGIDSAGLTDAMLQTISVFNNTISGPTKQHKAFTGWQWQGQSFTYRATLDFDLTSVTSHDLTISAPGVIENDSVSLGVPNGSVTADTLFWAWVSAADTITVRAMRTAGTPNPASGVFTATVVKLLTR